MALGEAQHLGKTNQALPLAFPSEPSCSGLLLSIFHPFATPWAWSQPVLGFRWPAGWTLSLVFKCRFASMAMEVAIFLAGTAEIKLGWEFGGSWMAHGCCPGPDLQAASSLSSPSSKVQPPGTLCLGMGPPGGGSEERRTNGPTLNPPEGSLNTPCLQSSLLLLFISVARLSG